MAMTARSVSAPRFLGDGRVGAWQRPVPDPGVDELLIEVRASAICGTDRDAWQHGADVVPGHEVSGVVAAAGPGTGTAVGTPGVVYLMDTCGSCRSCLGGATNVCLAKRGDVGFTRDGGFGPVVVATERQFFPVPDDLDLAEATLLLDVLGTAAHALRRGLAVVDDVRQLLVVGAGPVGLGVAAVAPHLLGADVRVVLADIVPYRLRLAEFLAALPLDVAARSLTDALASLGGPAPDLVVDTSGRQAAREEAFAAIAPRGALVCVGHGGGFSLDVSRGLIAPERAVLGSEYFRFDELPWGLDLLLRDRERIATILTHRFPASDMEPALAVFFGGQSGKVVVTR